MDRGDLNDRREDRVETKTLDSRSDKMKRRCENTFCCYCPPHSGENATRHAKHGTKKRRYKNKRR